MGDTIKMPAKCSGINYCLQLYEASVEVRRRPFQDKSRTLATSEIESVELLRKSVMPPALIGVICLIAYVALVLPDGWLMSVLPAGIGTYLPPLSLGIATVCLLVLIVRWLFTNLILRPSNTSPVTVKMVPARSARRFVALFQMQVQVTREA